MLIPSYPVSVTIAISIWFFRDILRKERKRGSIFFFFIFDEHRCSSIRHGFSAFLRDFPSLPPFVTKACLVETRYFRYRLSREENGIEIKSLFRYRAIRFDGCKEEFFSW